MGDWGRESRRWAWIPVRIATFYALISGLWILLSDRLLVLFVSDPRTLTRLQTIKGWFFVFATAILLYGLIRRGIGAIQRTEEVFGEIAQGVSPSVGEEFFRSLAEHLAKALGVTHVIVGELIGDSESIHTIAVYSQGEIQPNYEYRLSGTPCQDVVWGVRENRVRSYPRGVRKLFPLDPLLARLGAECYIGVPLLDSRGDPIGLITVIDQKPLPGEKAKRVEAMLQIFAARASAELERKRTDEALRESEARFRAIYENAPVMINSFSADGQIQLWNNECVRQLGYTREEVATAKDPLALIYPDPDYRQYVRETIAQHDGKFREFQVTLRDGNHYQLWANHELPDGSIISVGHDITERKRTEEALRESEARFRAIYENAPAMIRSFGPDRHIQLWNAECERQLGYTQAEMAAAQDPLAFIYPDPDYRAYVWSTIALKDGKFREFHVRTRSGTWHDQLWANFGLPDGSIISVGYDITERKRTEEVLRDTNEKLRALIESSPLAIMALDPQGNLKLWNPAAQSMFGWKAEEVLDRANPIVPINQKDEFRKLRERVLRGESFTGTELVRIRKDGTPIDVSLSTAPLYSGDGKIVGIMAVAADITERRLAETRLLASEANYRVIFEGASDAIFILDPENGRIVDANQKALSMYGYSIDEITQLNALEISSGESPYGRDEALQMLEKARTGEPQLFEWLCREKGGRTFWVEVSLRRIQLGGKERLLAIVRDITERKRAEEEARRREEWERRIEAEAEAAKREFYRGTIFSVTEGKLNLVSYGEIESLLAPIAETIPIRSSEDLAAIRQAAERTARELGMPEERIEMLVLAVGEAAANAVKHANGGVARVGKHDGSVQVSIRDYGPGMDTLILPRATLLRGFSTKPSMGLGYSMILASVDCVYLATEKQGTWVVMEMASHLPEVTYNVEALPDYW